MAITYGLAPNPKWYFVDMTGKPLGGGYMATLSSLNKSVDKIVFQDPAGNFPWPYVTIPNAGGDGILIDENGTQGPFYFEFDSTATTDLYFLQIYDADGVLQWSIDQFSSGGSGGGSVTETYNITNLIANNVMYRNFGASANPIASDFLVIAPGAHAGLTQTPSNAGPDICFIKNNTSASDQLSFINFTLGTPALTGDVTPVSFLRYVCSVAGSAETKKCVQFPVTSNVNNLSGQPVTFTIWARCNAGNASLGISCRQFFGDGTGASMDANTTLDTLTLTSNWVKYSIPVTLPSVSTMTLGPCHNDGVFIQMNYPLGATTSIDFTKPSLYLGTIEPGADYQTNDVIETIIDSDRTGDVRNSFNYSNNLYVPGGYIFANDGSIGNASSNALTRANIDTFPLYNLLWNNISDTYCPVFNSSGVYVGRGANAIADFSANNQIFIPLSLGRVLSGASANPATFSKIFTASANILTVNDTTPLYNGSVVQVSNTGGALPTPLMASTNYYVIIGNSTTISLASTLANAEAGIPITLSDAGSGVNVVTAFLNSYPLGLYTGQDTHAPVVLEMATHSHGITITQFRNLVGQVGVANSIAVNQGINQSVNLANISATIAPNGSGSPFNILQPTTYLNRLIKL